MAAVTPHSRQNNFNLLRFLAATAVIFSHSFILAGAEESEPVYVLTGRWNSGELGVNIFFVISGYLVTHSFIQRRNLWFFLEARFLRIFPALFAALLLTLLIIGPLATSLPLAAYFSDWDTWRYLLQNLSLSKLQPTLPGVFGANPEEGIVNTPLWTLPWEIRCYLGLALLGVIFVLPRPKAFKLAFVFALIAFFSWPMLSWLADPDSLAPLRLGAYFALGMLFYLARGRIPLRPAGVVALAVAAFTVSLFAPGLTMFSVLGVLLVYAVLWFALDSRVRINWFNRIGDYSYGLYIYAYPIQQTLVAYDETIGAWELFVLSFALTLPLAALSWHVLERRVLDLKGRLKLGSLANCLAPSPWEQVPIGIEQVDLRGPLLHVNRGLCEMLGYSREELKRLSFRDITHSDDLASEEKLLSQLIAGEIRSYSIEKRYLHKNGTPTPVRVTSSQVSHSGARDGYRISIIEDIARDGAAFEVLARTLEQGTAGRFAALKRVLPDRWKELNGTIRNAIAESIAYRTRARAHGGSLKLRTML